MINPEDYEKDIDHVISVLNNGGWNAERYGFENTSLHEKFDLRYYDVTRLYVRTRPDIYAYNPNSNNAYLLEVKRGHWGNSTNIEAFPWFINRILSALGIKIFYMIHYNKETMCDYVINPNSSPFNTINWIAVPKRFKEQFSSEIFPALQTSIPNLKINYPEFVSGSGDPFTNIPFDYFIKNFVTLTQFASGILPRE
jgi:hypothetical protein